MSARYENATKRGHIPLRMCVGCRQRRPAEDMLRLKVVGGTVVVSARTENVPGRGCYVCPEEPCVEKALKKGLLQKALRSDIAVTPSKEVILTKRAYLEGVTG